MVCAGELALNKRRRKYRFFFNIDKFADLRAF
jgi:hypothetical protein